MFINTVVIMYAYVYGFVLFYVKLHSPTFQLTFLFLTLFYLNLPADMIYDYFSKNTILILVR